MDINPGDRAATCGGLMQPIAFDVVGGEYFVIQRCEQCGHAKRNKLSQDDDLDRVVALMTGMNK